MPLASRYRPAATTLGSELDLIAPRIATMQAAYLSRHGRYLQLLPTHVSVPVEGAPKVADAVTRAPADRRRRDEAGAVVEDDSWSVTRVPTPASVSMAVHDYDGPQGRGYVVVGSILVGVDMVVAVRPVGPEKHRIDSVEVIADGR